MAMERSRRPWTARDFGGNLLPLRAAIDRLFESAFTTPFWSGFAGSAGMTGSAGTLGMDVDEDDEHYYVCAALPGIDPNAVNISVHNNLLTISGETKRTAPEGRRPVSQENSFGQFQRQVALPTPVDADNCEASYRDGMLTITLPKAAAHRPRTIQVKTGTGSI